MFAGFVLIRKKILVMGKHQLKLENEGVYFGRETTIKHNSSFSVKSAT